MHSWYNLQRPTRRLETRSNTHVEGQGSVWSVSERDQTRWKPVYGGSQPVHEGSKPVHEGSKPVYEGSKQVFDGTKPLYDWSK